MMSLCLDQGYHLFGSVVPITSKCQAKFQLDTERFNIKIKEIKTTSSSNVTSDKIKNHDRADM